MKMRTKILTGFAIVIAIFAVSIFLGITSLQSASDGFNQYRELARTSNLAGRLQANMLMVRMSVKDYIISRDEANLYEYEERFKAMTGFMAEAQERIIHVERDPLIDEADDKVQEYGEYFATVNKDIRHLTEIQTMYLDVIGPKIERELTEILHSAEADGDMIAAYDAALALRSLLLARLYTTKYINNSQLSAASRVRSEFSIVEEYYEHLEEELQNPTRLSLLKDAMALTDQYQAEFEKLVTTIQERDEIVQDNLDVLGPEIADKVEEMKLHIIAEQDDMGPVIQANNMRTIIVVGILSSIAIVAGVVVAMITIRSILKQLGEDPAIIENTMKEVANGVLEFKNTSGKEPVGVYRSVENMLSALQKKAQMVENVADGDLTVDIQIASERDGLGKNLVRMKDSLNDLLSQVRVAIDQVQSGSDQVSQSSQSLSQGATEQASSLEEISSSLNEVNGQAQQNAENATEANQIANQSSSNASQGNEKMLELVAAMEEINASSDEIRKVVKVIDDIAFQINLLALNANVEAARAGKYGKGFAVVAEEVRNLAVRSADAVKETTSMVDESIKSIEKGNKAAEATATQLSEIVEGADKVATFLAEIASASNEQAQAIAQITKGLDQIDQVTQANTASAEESASAAEELASQAVHLASMIGQFKLDSRNEAKQLVAPTDHHHDYSTLRTVSPAHQASPNQRHHQTSFHNHGEAEEDGVTPINPKEIINLEDDDFDRF